MSETLQQSSRSRLVLFGIVSIAFIIRLTTFGPLHADGYTGDEREYLFLGERIASGGPFIDSNGEYSTRSPLYPFLLAGLFAVFGDSLLIPHLVGCFLGAMSVYLVYLIGLRILDDDQAALAGAGISALYPGLVIYSGILQTESLYIVFFLLAILSGFNLQREPTWKGGIILGAWCGLAALTRAVFLGFFPLFLLLFLCTRKPDGARLYLPLGLSIVTFLLVLVPWTVRNYGIHETLIPVSSWSGKSLLIGNNPFATGTWSTKDGFEEWRDMKLSEMGLPEAQALNEVELNSASKGIALDYVLSHPIETGLIAFRKVWISWVYPITNSDANHPLQAGAVAADYLLFIMAGIGVLAARGNSKGLALIAVSAALYSLIHMVLHAEARYRLPLVPLLTVYAGAGCVTAMRNPEMITQRGLFRRRTTGLIVALSFIYVLLLVFFLKGLI